MKKHKKIVIIAFFIAVFVFLSDKVSAEEKSEPQASLRPKVEYKAEDLQEPFGEEKKEEEVVLQKKIVQIEPPPILAIQGIVWGGNLPQAIIENKVVKIGDTIQDVRIIDINKDGLVIFYHGQQYNLPSPAKADLKQKQKTQEGGLNEKSF